MSIILTFINDNGNFNKNFNSFLETLKNIIALLGVASKISIETSNSLLQKNILEILFSFLSHELGSIELSSGTTSTGQSTGQSTSSLAVKDIKSTPSSQKLIADILNLLSIFFPTKWSQDESKQKIMASSNREYFLYFSEKIISLLLHNIISISSSKIFIQVVKLLNLYVTYSNNDDINKFINSGLLANLNSSK